MVVLGGGAVSYERGTPVAASQRQCNGQAARPLLLILPPAPHPSPSDQILYVKEIKSKLSGNEIDHSNSFILLVKNMLCSEVHDQKV